MDYDEHLSRFEAKQKQLQIQAEEAKQRKIIALEEAFKEADQIIQESIIPELETLRDALERHSFRAKIIVTRDICDLSPDSTFVVEVQLREDVHPDNPRRGISFTAIPDTKCFTVRLVVSQNRQERPAAFEMKFVEATPEAVKRFCARFIEQAF